MDPSYRATRTSDRFTAPRRSARPETGRRGGAGEPAEVAASATRHGSRLHRQGAVSGPPHPAAGRLHGIRQRTGRGVDAVGHRVVVGVSGSSGSLTALHRAAAEARWRGAQLWVVLAWQPPGGDLGSRGPGGVPMAAAVKAAAVERLRLALDTA
ncbi:universal stress protein, partial [Streptomyces sp. SID7760]|nr:universal stress protein [Streptomyces sp. SID7760]